MNPVFDDEDDIEAAGRLVSYGFRPKVRPFRDLDYAALVRRYNEDPEFERIVQRYAAGLKLRVIGVTGSAGAVLAPLPGSFFETKLEPYARLFRQAQHRETERVLHGIVHLAAAALGFPSPADLADDKHVGRVSVKEIDRVVQDICKELDARAAAAGETGDPPQDEPELERVWRLYARRPEAAETRDDRAAPHTNEALVLRVVRYLVEEGMLTAYNEEAEESDRVFRTTSRYQLQVRELAALRLFEELTEIMNGPPISQGGLVRRPDSAALAGDQ
ncbi:hypothetical protein GCM10022254_41220 [Actinomadura meridiana]|uniref:Uncharacterized protein n=1 Tax=Actinomadura meridiana TaxID=559626 RepID=A0ABP8C7B8_9ACTN